MPIKILNGRQVITASGVPTVEVDMVTELGLFRVGVPSTDVKRVTEAVQLRDGGNDFAGMGCVQAVKNINNIIAPELMKCNLEVTMQKELDQLLLALDGTDNRSRLGANAILAVSMVIAKAGAARKAIPVYRHIADMVDVSTIILPVPHFTILVGGILSDNGLPFQEYNIMPTGATSFSEAMKMGVEIYNYVKNTIRDKYGVNSTYVADNGGFSIPLERHRDALLFLTDVIKVCGYTGRVEIALNAAATDCCKEGGAYDLDFKNPNSNPQDYVSADKLAELYLDNMKEFGVISVEDPFQLDEWASFCSITPRTPNQILANDLTQTNVRRVGLAVDKKASTTVALRLSQSATISEVIECYKMLRGAGLSAVVADRLGDTDDLFLADMVVGLSAGQFKCGAPARGERVGKYNQILRIEQELGALAKYAGKNYRNQL